MRPIRLDVSGLRSFRGAQSIDFSDLGLFAVVGDTGSGKSSILEAMIYALYNATSWSERDVRELIASDCDAMKVVFDFRAGAAIYRVTRSTSRLPGRPPVHALRSLTDSAYRADGERAVNDEIKRIVGLDYATFRKTVVLPQGRFAELLLAKDAERQRILGDLLGLDEVDRLRAALGPAREEARALRSRLDGARAELGPDPSGRLRTLRDESAAALADVQAFEVTAAQFRDALPRRRSITETEAAVASVGRALALFDAPIVTLRALRDQETALAQAVESARARRAETREEAQRGTDRAQALRESGRDLAEVTRYREVFHSVRTQRASLAGEAADLDGLKERLTAQRRSLEAAIDAKTSIVAQAEAAEAALQDANTAYEAARQRYRRASETWIRLEAARNEAREVDGQVEVCAARQREAIAACVPAQQTAEETEAVARRARSALEEAQAGNAIAAVAHGLHAGDRCPVCSRALPKTFAAPTDADLVPLVEACKSADRARERATKTFAAAEAAVEATVGALADAMSKQQRYALRRAEAEAAVCAMGLEPSAPSEDVATAEMRASEAALREAAREVGARRDGARSAADRANSSIEEQERAHEALGRDTAAAARRLDARRQRWDGDRTSLPEEYRPAGEAEDEAYRAIAPALEQAIAHAKQIEDESRAAVLADQRAERDLHESEMRYRQEIVDPAVTAHHRLDEAVRRTEGADVDRLLIASPVPSGKGVTVSVAWADALSDWAAAARIQVEERAATLARDRQMTEELIAGLLARHDVTSYENFELGRGKAQTIAGAAQTRLDTAQETVRRAEQLDTEREALAPVERALNVLDSYLLARSFKEWLMRRREATLLGLATEILRKMTRGRYAFAARFRIVDGNSGLERSPQTLSGGETFLGSLALALAVVEATSRTGGKIEAMFLDEGFGTLDAAALDEALGELANRASGGHLIGIVTHVRGVAEIIETVLRVRRFPSGSIVQRLDVAERAAFLENELAAGLLGSAGDLGSGT